MNEKRRTLAFQVEEELFERVKQYLERHQITQKAFVIGLIEDELDRDEELLRKQQERNTPSEEETQDEALSESSEAPVGEDGPGNEYEDEPEEAPAVGDFEGSSGGLDEEGAEQESAGDEPEHGEAPNEDFTELEDGEFPESADHDEDISEGGFDVPDEDGTELNAEDYPGRGFIEGKSGAAIEVAPNYNFGEEIPPPFPESDDEEDQEFGGMSMSM